MYERTQAQINLNALEANIAAIRQKIGPDTKLLGVIKADAYGHGAAYIGRRYEENFDFYGVACIEEAMELRRAGVTLPILVLGPVFPDDFPRSVEQNVRLPIFSMEAAKALSAEAVRQGKQVPFHFALDTGMSRIGFQVNEESADICKAICDLPGIYPEGLFSHFATADETSFVKAEAQRQRYLQFCDLLEQRGVEIPIKHLNNSAGIMRLGGSFNMVRAGIILYGLYPSEEVDKSLLPLQPVLRWVARVSHVKTLEPGREISYGGTYTTSSPRRVATIPVGYADGYPRCLSGMGQVLIGGKRAPILGRVCMDQFMVDVTEIPSVQVGTPVTLVGTDGNETLSMEEVSGLAHSFNYELPCRIARRVPRVYYRDGVPVDAVEYIPV